MPLFPPQLVMRKRDFYFCRILLIFEEKILEIDKHIWLSISWIPKNQTPCKPVLKTLQKSNYSISLVPSEENLLKSTFHKSNSQCLEQILCFILTVTLSLFIFVIWSYLESTVAAPMPFLHKLFIYIYSQPKLSTQNSQWNFCTVQQKVTIFFPPWSNFEIKLQV